MRSNHKENNKQVISKLLIDRESFVEIIILSLIFALAINLITDLLPVFIPLSNTAYLIIAVVLLFLSIGSLLRKYVFSKGKVLKYRGFFILRKEDNKIVSIPRYDFGSRLSEYFTALCIENSAYKRLWDSEPLTSFIDYSQDPPIFLEVKSKLMVIEAIEYYILNKLSLHLSSYFENKGFRQDLLQKYSREDIPDILMRNRFLELFSKDMESRPLFSDMLDENSGGTENTVYAYKQGAIYDRFNLILPNKSSIYRDTENRIVIETSKIKLRITIDFSCFSSSPPDEFYYYMLSSRKSIYPFDTYDVNVEIDISFKWQAYLLRRSWIFFYWVDSFLDYFEKEFCRDQYLDRINWKSNLLILDYLSGRLDSYNRNINNYEDS